MKILNIKTTPSFDLELLSHTTQNLNGMKSEISYTQT